MRFTVPFFALAALMLGAAQAQAQASCSTFVMLESYDAAGKAIEVAYEKGNMRKYFPKPEGTPADSTKIPKPCSRRLLRDSTTLDVTPTGGRFSVTQIRSNLDGKMLNDTESEDWFKGEIDKLIGGKAPVVAILRPGPRDAAPKLTTIYLPITDEEVAEIARREAQAEDVD